MGLFRKLFGEKRKQTSQKPSLSRVPPGLRVFAAELPRFPSEERRILERILVQAIEADVTSLEELLVFLNSRPDLMSIWGKVIFDAMGEQGRRSRG